MPILTLVREYAFGVLMLSLLSFAWFYLVTDGKVLLSAVGGVCSALLWAGEAWQRKNGKTDL